MGEVKELNINNQTYYFFDDMIDIRNFYSNLLKIDRKSHKDIDIYYIGYVTIKKFNDCKNIHCVNLLYLIIYSATGHFNEKNGEKYLIIHSTRNTKKFFLGLYKKSKQLLVEKNYFMKKKIMLKLELILTRIYL